MAQPPRYERVKNFGEDYGDETDNAAIDSELDSVSQSINSLRDNLAIIQRDDGGLKDGIVTSSTIDKGVLDDIAETVASDVNDQVLAAEQYSVNAYNSAISAQNSVISAQGQAITASQKATESENFAFVASQWANKPYSPVEGGDYSAKYWAQQAASSSGVVPATEVLAGIARLATAQEVAAGVVQNATVPPKHLKPLLDAKANLNSPAFTGTVTGITKDMVGLDKVDNTADLDKPISNAMQEVLDEKADSTYVNTELNKKVSYNVPLNASVVTTSYGQYTSGLLALVSGGGYPDWRERPSAVIVEIDARGAAYNGIKWVRQGDKYVAALQSIIHADGACEVVIAIEGVSNTPFSFNGSTGAGYAVGAWNSGSDRRLKENIVPVSSVLSAIQNWKPSIYSKFDKLELGLIAQEVQETLPALVTNQGTTQLKDGTAVQDTLALNYGGVAAVAIGAINELHELVRKLEERLSELGRNL